MNENIAKKRTKTEERSGKDYRKAMTKEEEKRKVRGNKEES